MSVTISSVVGKLDFPQQYRYELWTLCILQSLWIFFHDDVIKWKHFPRCWPFVRGIHRSPVNSPHKGQWRGALMFSLICAWINGRVNNREAGDLRRHRKHYDVTVMLSFCGKRPTVAWVTNQPNATQYYRSHIQIWFMEEIMNIRYHFPDVCH